MPVEAPEDITALVHAWRGGDRSALDRLVPVLEAELRRIARQSLQRWHPNESVNTTSLVNEAFVRLLSLKTTECGDRAHFFALCATIIRGILVDHARKHAAAKRGGGVDALPLIEGAVSFQERRRDLIAIDEALTALAELDSRRSRVVELRFFGGLTVEETAEAMGISSETVKRDWRVAKLWLIKELRAPRYPIARGS